MVTVLALCVGCSGRVTGPESSMTTSSTALPAPLFVNWPPQANNFRFHWSAAEGIDLETGPAVALRAYIESYRLVGFAGGDLSAVYAGFMRATPPNVPKGGPETVYRLVDVRPKSRAEHEAKGWTYTERAYYGYQPTYIMNLVPHGDGYRATLCLGLYSVYRTVDGDPAKFVSTAADPNTGKPLAGSWANIEVWRVELTEVNPTADRGPSAAMPAQRGPLPAPIDDVFGRWFITAASSNLWGTADEGEFVDPPEVRAQCQDAMPDDEATRNAMATGLHDSPPAHGDPIPGWPANGR